MDITEKEIVYHLGKPVGYIQYGVYHTFREPDTFFIKYHSFGISEEVINKLERKGVRTVVVHYRGKKESANFIARIEDFLKYGKIYYFGSDKQYQLHTSYFTKQVIETE